MSDLSLDFNRRLAACRGTWKFAVGMVVRHIAEPQQISVVVLLDEELGRIMVEDNDAPTLFFNWESADQYVPDITAAPTKGCLTAQIRKQSTLSGWALIDDGNGIWHEGPTGIDNDLYPTEEEGFLCVLEELAFK